MVIRYGFVSNSSSTTFICPACDHSSFGWDWEDDPICSNCGCHIYGYSVTFADYIIKKYDLDVDKERSEYIRSQRQITTEDSENYNKGQFIGNYKN